VQSPVFYLQHTKERGREEEREGKEKKKKWWKVNKQHLILVPFPADVAPTEHLVHTPQHRQMLILQPLSLTLFTSPYLSSQDHEFLESKNRLSYLSS
jgi:hypothetical protein